MRWARGGAVVRKVRHCAVCAFVSVLHLFSFDLLVSVPVLEMWGCCCGGGVLYCGGDGVVCAILAIIVMV